MLTGSWLRGMAVVSLLSLSLFSSACGQVEISKVDDVPNGMLSEDAPKLEVRPYGLACSFLDAINSGEYDKAYGYLGSEAQGYVSKSTFVSSLASYMKTASTRQAYALRRVSTERIEGITGYVTVIDSQSTNSKPWIWEFEHSYDGWKIRSLDLPPVAVHKERYSS